MLRVGLEAQAADHIVAMSQAFGAADQRELIALDTVLREITTAQERRDLLRLADLLEFQLPLVLRREQAA